MAVTRPTPCPIICFLQSLSKSCCLVEKAHFWATAEIRCWVYWLLMIRGTDAEEIGYDKGWCITLGFGLGCVCLHFSTKMLKSYSSNCSDVWWQMVQHTNPAAGWNLPIFDIFETFTCVFLEKEPLPKKNHHWEIENSLKVFYLFNGFFMRMFEHEAPPSKNPHLEKAWWKPSCWLPHPKGPTVIKAVFPPIEASR